MLIKRLFFELLSDGKGRKGGFGAEWIFGENETLITQ
jgi:hypothetical protein